MRVRASTRRHLHAIDAPPARRRGDAGSSPLDGASTAASSPRNDLVKIYRVHPTHWLISTQALAILPAPATTQPSDASDETTPLLLRLLLPRFLVPRATRGPRLARVVVHRIPRPAPHLLLPCFLALPPPSIFTATTADTAAAAPIEHLAACVEIIILRRVRAESSRRHPRHRRDVCSMAWRCRFLTA